MIRIALLALIAMVPLTVLADSLSMNALVMGLGAGDLARTYVTYTWRGLALIVFATLLGLGCLFPAQVRLRLKKLANT